MTPSQRFADLWGGLGVSMQVALALIVAGALIAGTLAISSSGASPEKPMVPLLGGFEFSLDARESAIKAFKEAKLADYSFVGTKVMVPADKQAEYLGALASSKSGLPGNTDDAIDRYIEEQRSWWASTAESERLFRVAEERRVARVIESFPEIDHAAVLVSDPPERGTLRAQASRGSAAVKVTTVDGSPLHPARAEQIKMLVAGNFREVGGIENVQVISDSLTLASGDAGGMGGMLMHDGSNRYLTTKAAFAMQIENKIRGLFADLKGLIVTVNAELDPRFKRSERVDNKEKGPVRRESSDTNESASSTPPPASAGGEPGTRTNVDAPGATPNQGAQASAAVAASDTDKGETSEKEYEVDQVLTDQSFVDFEPVRVGVVVRYRIPPAEQPPAGGSAPIEGPSPQQIREMVASLGYPGVSVDSVSVQPYTGAEPPPVEVPEPSFVDMTVRHLPAASMGIAGLAAIAVAFVVSRRAPVPRMAKMAEIAVQNSQQMVFAAPNEPASSPKDESVNEFKKIQDEINKLVKDNPDAAAAIIRRWVQESA
jgi:flagellar biosynthesis/type III secretory pathway M-ring protein FliF/YscJ